MDQAEITKNQNKPGCRNLTIIGIILFLLVLIAPRYIPLKVKPPAGEGRTNLGYIFTAQVKYFSDHGTYADGSNAFKLLNWEPKGSNQYAYFCGGDFIPNKKGDSIPRDLTPLPWGIQPDSSDIGFTCMAVGNIDNDPDLDYWFINDSKMIVNEPTDR